MTPEAAHRPNTGNANSRVEWRESLLAAPQPVLRQPLSFRSTWLVQFRHPSWLVTANGQRSRRQLTLVLARLWRTGTGCVLPLKKRTRECLFFLCDCWLVCRQKATLRSRSQSGINGPPYGLPSIYSVCSLDLRSTFCRKGSCHFFFRKSDSFFWLITRFVLARALVA